MALTHARPERLRIQVRKGDQVKVLAGKDAGKSGRVLSVNPVKNTVVVEHVSIIKRHTRAQAGSSQPGGVIEKEGPIHVSNVMVADPKDGKPTRVGVEVEDGKRYRVAKRSGTRLD